MSREFSIFGPINQMAWQLANPLMKRHVVFFLTAEDTSIIRLDLWGKGVRDLLSSRH